MDRKDTGTFVNRWKGVTASELATAQSYFIELCELLDVEKPHPTDDQAYMFECPLRPNYWHESDRDMSRLVANRSPR